MTESKVAYSVEFGFTDQRVMDAQQAEMIVGADGQPRFNKESLGARLVKNKFWASVGSLHRHERGRIVALFDFITCPSPEDLDPDRVVEAALFDMYAWLDETGLTEEVLPVTVELRKASTGQENIHTDYTVEAIALIGKLAALKGLTPDDFQGLN